MNTAKCIENNELYDALEFLSQSAVEIERRRHLLQCPECNGPAFFRNASQIGRGPCFGARPHADGCRLAACSGTDDGHANSQISDGRIIVDFSYGSPYRLESTSNPGHPRRLRGNGIRPDGISHHRLSTLLRFLIDSPEFSHSDQIIDIYGNQFYSKDFFVPVQLATENLHGRLRGFWGRISTVRFSKDYSEIWFNTGGFNNISFYIDSTYFDEIVSRYGVRNEQAFAGASILVVGALRVVENGRLFCEIQRPELMALKLQG